MNKHEHKHRRTRKHLPYGGKREKSWCPVCDRYLVEEVNKRCERQKAKKELKEYTKIKIGGD